MLIIVIYNNFYRYIFKINSYFSQNCFCTSRTNNKHSFTSQPKYLNICLVEYFMDSSSMCNIKTFIIITIGPFMKAIIAFHDFKYVRLFC